jgi:flagellar hook-length control protein FliK
MNSIPATSCALGPVCARPGQARPAGTPAANPQPSGVSRPLASLPGTPEDLSADPETGTGAPDAGLGIPPMAQFPMWRTLPSQGSLSGGLVLTGHPLPKGGKALPPRMPTLPVVMPSPDALAPGASGSPGLPVAIAAAAAAVDSAEVAVPAPAMSPDAASPPVTSAPDSLSTEEPGPARQPQEIIGRLPGANGALSVPVPAGPRVQVPGAAAPDAAADSPPSSPPIATGMPAWMLRARPAPALGHAPPGAFGLATALTQAAEVAATNASLERAAAAETGAAAGQAARLSVAPDAAILSTATLAQPAQQGSPAIVTAQQHLPEMVGSEEWAEAVAQRLTQLADSPQARASIRLNPPQLGPMQVEVHIDGDRAVVQLAVHHDATRDALEQAMPKLRAQLEDSGFTRIDVSVSHNPHRERPGNGEAYVAASSLPDDDLPSVAAGSGSTRVSSSRLLDAYA